MSSSNRYKVAGIAKERGPENLEVILREAPRFFRAQPWRPT
jgi:hypothetical protein